MNKLERYCLAFQRASFTRRNTTKLLWETALFLLILGASDRYLSLVIFFHFSMSAALPLSDRVRRRPSKSLTSLLCRVINPRLRERNACERPQFACFLLNSSDFPSSFKLSLFVISRVSNGQLVARRERRDNGPSSQWRCFRLLSLGRQQKSPHHSGVVFSSLTALFLVCSITIYREFRDAARALFLAELRPFIAAACLDDSVHVVKGRRALLFVSQCPASGGFTLFRAVALFTRSERLLKANK